MQFSPSTLSFQNFDVSTANSNGISSGISSYIPKVSLDTFNLGIFEDWICWENQSNHAPSLSPTETINTSVTSPPVIFFKPEDSQPLNLRSPSPRDTIKSSFNENSCIIGEGYMKNPISFDRQDVHPQNTRQKLPRGLSGSKSLNNGQKEEYSFHFSCPPESPLDFIDEERPNNHCDNKINRNSKTSDLSAVGCNSLLKLSFTQGQNSCPPKLTTHLSEKHENKKSVTEKSQIKIQNTELFEIESSVSEESRPFSSSPFSFQSYTGPNSQKSKSVRSIPRKRKSRDFQHTKNGSSNPQSAPKNLYSSRNSNETEETQVNGIVHRIGRTKTPKKTAHNMIEKRYRTNLNDKIAALRDAVPSLRVAIKNNLSFVQEVNRKDFIDRKMEQKNDEHCGRIQGNEDLKAEMIDLQDLPVVHKLNKATILTKAAEYIAYLETRNRKLLSENSALETRLNAFEVLEISPKSEEI